jgi:hypothetical protein
MTTPSPPNSSSNGKNLPQSPDPPAQPWHTGVHEDYSAFVVEVNICEGTNRMVYSTHQFRGPEDQDVARRLLSSGEQQMAFSLLTEAMRREAYLQGLIKAKENEGFLSQYKDGDPQIRTKMEREIALSLAQLLNRTVCQMAPGVAQEILTMMSSQAG